MFQQATTTDAAHGVDSSRETSAPSLVERIHDAIDGLAPVVARTGCPLVWARGAGPHVLLGMQGEEAFARITPLGGGLFGLAFRSLTPAGDEAADPRDAAAKLAWEPLLLIDELAAVVEHALVAVEAIVIQ